MQPRLPIVERAFQLADTGLTLPEVKCRLKTEGYFEIQRHLVGPMLLRALSARARAARLT
jgi:hypothetical protein